MMGITFDPSLGFGSLLTMGVMIVGGIGAWYTYKTEFKEFGRRQSDLEVKVARIDTDLQAQKLHASEHFVRRDDIEKLEDRLGKMFNGLIEGIGRRMETVEHMTRNIDTKILSIVTMVNKRQGAPE